MTAIEHFPAPRDVTSVKSFLGLANFYRIFVGGYSNIARPLNSLLCKGVQFVWDEQCEAAFQQLKQRLMQSPILATADFDLPFLVFTDASKYALGGILGQVQDGKSRVIAYASRTLNKHELNYSVSEKEALAIVWAINHWQHYLLSDKQFTVITDHHPLTGLKNIKDMHGRLGRWSLALQHYNFIVQYRPGEKNQVDALSRVELATTDDLEQYTESSSVPLKPIHELLCPPPLESYLVVPSFSLTRQIQAGQLDESGDSSSEEGSCGGLHVICSIGMRLAALVWTCVEILPHGKICHPELVVSWTSGLSLSHCGYHLTTSISFVPLWFSWMCLITSRVLRALYARYVAGLTTLLQIGFGYLPTAAYGSSGRRVRSINSQPCDCQ